MASKQVTERVAELRDTIRYHDERYYGQDAPEISDGDYDDLMRELRELEAEHPDLVTADSPTQRPGAATVPTPFSEVRHLQPMLSLDNAFCPEDLVAWEERLARIVTEDIAYVGEPKLDGLAISLLYEDGRARPRRHAWQRRDRRGRDRQRDHDRRPPPEARGPEGPRACSRCAARSSCRSTRSPS